jgi:hypothetical protein
LPYSFVDSSILFRSCRYVPSVSLVDDVFRNKARAFEVTGMVIGIVWIVFATLLYATTKDDTVKFDDLTMGQRYHNIPNSFQYAFIHLSGDYPFVDYTPWGRLVNVFIILIAVAVVGVPFGLVSSGFSEVLEQVRFVGTATGSRDATSVPPPPSHPSSSPPPRLTPRPPRPLPPSLQRKQAAAAEGQVSLVADLESMTLTATTASGEEWSAEIKDGHTLDQLKRAAQRALGVSPSAPKQRVVMTDDDEDDGSPLILSSAASDPHRRKAMCEQMQENVCAFLEGSPEASVGIRKASSAYHNIMLFLIILNVLLVLVETVDEITDVTGHGWFDFIEWASVVIFTAEFAARVFSAPANPKVSVLLFTITCYANLAHSLTRSP